MKKSGEKQHSLPLIGGVLLGLLMGITSFPVFPQAPGDQNRDMEKNASQIMLPISGQYLELILGSR